MIVCPGRCGGCVEFFDNTGTRTFFFSTTCSTNTHTDHAKEGLHIRTCQGKLHFPEAASRQAVAETEAWVQAWTQSKFEDESEALLLEEAVPVQNAVSS